MKFDSFVDEDTFTLVCVSSVQRLRLSIHPFAEDRGKKGAMKGYFETRIDRKRELVPNPHALSLLTCTPGS